MTIADELRPMSGRWRSPDPTPGCEPIRKPSPPNDYIGVHSPVTFAFLVATARPSISSSLQSERDARGRCGLSKYRIAWRREFCDAITVHHRHTRPCRNIACHIRPAASTRIRVAATSRPTREGVRVWVMCLLVVARGRAPGSAPHAAPTRRGARISARPRRRRGAPRNVKVRRQRDRPRPALWRRATTARPCLGRPANPYQNIATPRIRGFTKHATSVDHTRRSGMPCETIFTMRLHQSAMRFW